MSEPQKREVMYIGRKPRKADNVTGNVGRVWAGLGDVKETSSLEAEKLCVHGEVWADVTGWDQAKRMKVVSSVRETIRTEARRHQKVVPIHLASEEELEEQLARIRGKGAPLKAASRAPAANVPVQKAKDNTNQETGEEKTRPAKPNEVVTEIVSAIQGLDPDQPQFFDSDGHPTKEALELTLGYIISDSERKAAIKAWAEKVAASKA